MPELFSVGLTSDFLTPEGTLPYKDIGLSVLEAEPGLQFRFMDPHPMTLAPEHIRGFNAIVSLAPKYTRETFRDAGQLILISRFGVGFDVVDVQACTEADVALCTAKGAVDHSMAEAIVTWMLALSYRIFAKDRLLRENGWAKKLSLMGGEIRGRQLGVIGLGGIGKQLVRKLRGFEMKVPLVYDPFIDPQVASSYDVQLSNLDDLLKKSDFVAVCCPLNSVTKNLINRSNIGFMRPETYVINVARGGIVEEAPLVEALSAGRLAGAAFDVFAEQPAGSDHPLAGLPNVILAPHCIGWTHEMFAEIGRVACRSAVLVSHGHPPEHLINPEVLARPGFQRKLARFQKPVC